MAKTLAAALAASSLMLAGAAAAQPADHSKMPGMKGGDHMSMAMSDFMAAGKKSDQAMMAAKGKTVDATFAKKMIEHHKGAIDMARVELQHGADAQAKQFAQKTIDENTRGIEELQAWLRAHGG